MNILLRRRFAAGIIPPAPIVLGSLRESVYGEETIVTIAENGVFADYLVLKHDYENSGGTLLLRKDLYQSEMKWKTSSSNSNMYSGSLIDTFLIGEYTDMLSSAVRTSLTQAEIQHMSKPASGEMSTMQRSAFLLSVTELGLTGSVVDGSALVYFQNDASRIAYRGNGADAYFTRSAVIYNTGSVYSITIEGKRAVSSATTSGSVRPAIVLSATTVVNSDMTIG